MRNISVSLKSIGDEAQVPCIGSRAIRRSTSWMTSGLTSFRQLQRFPEAPVTSLDQHQFQHSNSRKAPCTSYRLEMRADSLALTEEVSQLSTSTTRDASLSNRYVRWALSLLPPVEWTPRCPDSKEGWISLHWLECRLIFHHTR